MKVFCFSFIVYLLILLTQPCQDVFALEQNNVDSKTYASKPENPTETDPQSEECSPFCICGCCSHAVANQSFFSEIATMTAKRDISTQMVEYKNPYTPKYLDSIWQPPKA